MTGGRGGMGRILGVAAHRSDQNAWTVTRVAPPPALRGLVDHYADYQERVAGFTTRRELPHAEGVLIVNLGEPIAITDGDGARHRFGPGEGFMAGAHLLPALSQAGGSQAGVHVFLPLATLRRLSRIPMAEMRNRVVPLDAVLGGEARRLGEALGEAREVGARAAALDAALMRLAARSAPLEARQMAGLAALRRGTGEEIGAIATALGWSRKHFAARIEDAVGVGPRCFRRLLRFQRLSQAAAAAEGRPDWAALALDAGYCDQAHMIREFREFAGMTPGAYAARRLPDGGGLVEA
jgi:AraC-like DNA-binding protein